MTFEFWQAPDRDSPKTAAFSATAELGRQLGLLLQMEGRSGTKEEDVKAVTGEDLSRPRRWHKIFERMGLLFLNDGGVTELTDLGRFMVQAEATASKNFRRELARLAVSVLRKYQLKNPVDEGEDHYPDDCDIHPYWAVWKAAIALDGRIHWDELNREIFRVRSRDLGRPQAPGR